jgi:hypothetical protein
MVVVFACLLVEPRIACRECWNIIKNFDGFRIFLMFDV